ncbi:MAG: aldo/keto reductase [Bacteroidales bacterium]|nr:aldo/keto reductase [Bacteroidales bacterium]
MIYSDFKGIRLSKLGFGTMRLPLEADGHTIDQKKVEEMTDYAMKNGINYFDTAFPYHAGLSEISIGKALSKYPRESWYLADKFPGHQHADTFNPQETFELQLSKCEVDYFDFYLLHNVCENSYATYFDERWKIIDYFIEQRKKGRIKHLGFSSHADLPTLEKFLDTPYGKEMEFCQIQLNFIDWTLQKAERKCEILRSRGLPIWVMEPVRGGKLAALSDDATALLKSHRPEESTAAWAFRWVQSIPGVTMVLSGMSNLEQMKDNVKTFDRENPLSAEENDLIMKIADSLHNTVPCTGCRYCCDGCPAGLDIPILISAYNDLSMGMNFTPLMRIESLPEEKQPSACLACGSCMQICPQGIKIPEVLAKLTTIYDGLPKWKEICKQRAEEAARLASQIKK